MPVSAARKIAFAVLCQVASEGAYASEVLNTRLGSSLARADAALATELTLGVLRRQRLLDFILQRHLDRPAERLDQEVLIALRLGVYQLRYLERVPAHAAVGESVELIKSARKGSAAALVNAVLRRAASSARAPHETLQEWLPSDASDAERTAILHSHPTWLVERWLAGFGAERTSALLEADNRAPRLSCAVLDRTDVAAVTGTLTADGLRVAPGRWLRFALTLSGGNPTATTAFQSGLITIQDEASQMIAHLVAAEPGQMVLDLCAAPGGKTTLLARATPGGMVVATDLHGHRLRVMREQLARTHTHNVLFAALDATRPLPFCGKFSRILVDAPCSGTGTLARNPEIRWRLQSGDIAAAHRSQVAMLCGALALLAPGGRLVYSTCSLEPEENEQVVQEALAVNKTARIVPAPSALTGMLRDENSPAAFFDDHGFFRTFPPETDTDGFFAAIIESPNS